MIVTLSSECTTELPAPPSLPPLVSKVCDAARVRHYVGRSFATFTLSDVKIG